MSQRSARLIVHGRLLIVQRHRAGWKQAHIVAAMGVSRKCVSTWNQRYDAEGEQGLQNRSSRPHSRPTCNQRTDRAEGPGSPHQTPRWPRCARPQDRGPGTDRLTQPASSRRALFA